MPRYSLPIDPHREAEFQATVHDLRFRTLNLRNEIARLQLAPSQAAVLDTALKRVVDHMAMLAKHADRNLR